MQTLVVPLHMWPHEHPAVFPLAL